MRLVTIGCGKGNMGKLLAEGATWIYAEFTGTIRRDDYQKIIVDKAAEAVEKYGQFNLVFSFQDHQGWEPEAADLSMTTISTLAKYTGKVAYINPPPKKILQVKLLKPLIKGEVRFFDTGQADEALAWVSDGAA